MRKRRRLGGVLKRCQHADKELCACSWHYAVQHDERKFRGIIPGVTSKEEALAAYALIVGRVKNGLPAIVETASSSTLSVEELAEEWLSLPRDRKASTRGFYRDVLRVHVKPALGARAVAGVTHEDLERHVTTLDASDNTKKVVARTLHALFAFAITPKKLRLDNPAHGLLKALKNPDTDRDEVALDPNDHQHYFTADESRHLLTVARDECPDWYDFVLVALQTGMRLGEIRALRYDRVNWHGGHIAIPADAGNYVRGKFTSPKNGKARTVSLSRDLRAALRLRRFKLRTTLVFESSEGTPLAVSRIARAWENLLKLAELDYRRFHACRHTHTSLMLQSGESPAKVAAEAGRSLDETMRTYAHFLPGGNRQSAEVLAALLRPETRVSPERLSTATKRPRTAARGELRRVV
jgi:integrase